MNSRVRTVVAGAFTAAMVAGVRPVAAEPISIPNAGFENRVAEFVDGQHKYPQPALDIWRHFECDNNGGPLRLWNPGVAGTTAPGFGGEAPEGQMVMRIYICRSRKTRS